MVTAAASTAKPMICPLTRRVSSGNDAETSAIRMGTCAGDGDAEGDGETRAEPVLCGPSLSSVLARVAQNRSIWVSHVLPDASDELSLRGASS